LPFAHPFCKPSVLGRLESSALPLTPRKEGDRSPPGVGCLLALTAVWGICSFDLGLGPVITRTSILLCPSWRNSSRFLGLQPRLLGLNLIAQAHGGQAPAQRDQGAGTDLSWGFGCDIRKGTSQAAVGVH